MKIEDDRQNTLVACVMTDFEYTKRANRYRPKTIAENRTAAMDLLRSGYSDHDIARILGASVEQLRRLIGRQQ